VARKRAIVAAASIALEREEGAAYMAVKTVGVIGCGLMGSGIAQVSAQAGFATTVVEANQELLDKGLGGITKSLDALVAKAKIDERAKNDTLGRLTGATALEALRESDLVIEAITENQALKNETFAKLDKICPPNALLASNTSSCNITAMAAATRRPGQVLGLHFFNPVPLMKLVEVVQTILTDEKTVAAAYEWVQAVGKAPVRTKDSTAFIVNRLLVPYLLDAIRIYEGGLASLEDIDQAMKLGCGYPMGPFTLLDLVGLDTTMYVAEVMFEEFREPRYAPPPLLKRMVMAGHLGRKSGKGFYNYGGK
jgi:3-hydroxybutyryl-CoA dehydrogenase